MSAVGPERTDTAGRSRLRSRSDGRTSASRETIMANDRAKQFVEFLASTEAARSRLLSAEPGQRRAIMTELGYGDVDAQEVDMLLQPAASDLSDEQLSTIQGGTRRSAIIWD